MRMFSSPAIFWAKASSSDFTESGMSAESAGKVMRIWPSVAAAGGTEAVCAVPPVPVAALPVAAVPVVAAAAAVPVSLPVVAAGAAGAVGVVELAAAVVLSVVVPVVVV